MSIVKESRAGDGFVEKSDWFSHRRSDLGMKKVPKREQQKCGGIVG